jgi:hypothetical protein
MASEGIIERQRIDCNCNDCKFMIRNQDRFRLSLEFHYKLQFDYFTSIKNRLIKKANEHKDRWYDLETWDMLLTEAEGMKFQFDKSEACINYGYCGKLNKDVSFIPNICQLETQQCFSHRKD